MVIFILLLLINFTGLIVVAADKYKAVHKRWRIPERFFFLLALMGGGPGVYWGCLQFRHKTKHKSFMWGIPVIIGTEIATIIYFYYFYSNDF
jgi:uncharacterized membrane protein YsdA (DUF1294 family)